MRHKGLKTIWDLETWSLTYSPSTQFLISLQSKGGKESKSIDITSVVNIPNTIPEGKEVLPKGKEVGNHQTPLFSTGLD